MSAAVVQMFPAPPPVALEPAPVVLKAPANLSASIEAHRRVTLKWSPVAGADRYLIERAESSREFKALRDTKETTFIDRNCFHKTTYRYRARAAASDGSTSPYSKIAKAKTLDEQSPFKQQWMRVFVDGRRDSPVATDPDTACQAASLKACWDLAKGKHGKPQIPLVCGRKWNIENDLFIEGYMVAKEALPAYVPSKGPLDGFLYETAKGRIRNAAHEQFTIGGRRDNGYVSVTGEKKPLTSIVTEAEIHYKAGKTGDKHDAAAVGYLADAEQELAAERDAIPVTLMELESWLETISEEDRNILLLRHVAGLTLTAIAKTLGMSYTTLQRRAEALDAKYGLSSRGVDRISKK